MTDVAQDNTQDMEHVAEAERESAVPEEQGAASRRPVTETAERFLRAILGEIPVAHIEVLYLFRPLRQGQVETGVAVVAAAPPEDPAHRHTVHTARYRLVVKGPDRGRWEYDCVAEADAPLLTIETVVRGVQQRSGDDAEPVLYDPASLAHVLRLEPVAPQDSDTLAA